MSKVVKEVRLTTTEPSAVDRKCFPLTVGVPFAPGALPANEPLAILDQSGSPQPLQTRVMETNADGSVRWLLLDYQSDLSSLAGVSHTLVTGQKGVEPAKDRRIEVKEQGKLLVISNGTLKLEVDPKCCRPILRIWRNGRLVSEGGLEFTVSAAGKTYRASSDSQANFRFDERGPLRTVLRWDGKHKDTRSKGHLDFCIRMTVYAGQPFVRLDHVFINRLDVRTAKVKSITARMPLAVGTKTTNQLADVRPELFQTEQTVQAQQFDLQHVRFVNAKGKLLKKTERPGRLKVLSPGWADVSGEKAGVFLAPKSYWQNYPKATTVSSKAIEYHLIPDRGKLFEIPRGMAKTHTFFLQFHDGLQNQQSRNMMAHLLNRWPMPAADSNHYGQSKEIWDIFPYEPRKYPQLEIALRELFHMDNGVATVDYSGEKPGKAYGLKHYGDFLNQGAPEWSIDPYAKNAMYLNNEYDTAHVYTMLFLHNHEVIEWWEAEAHALHCMDIDTCHHVTSNADDYRIADLRFMPQAQYPHCYQHIGDHSTPEETTDRPALGSHTFAEGVFDYYHLTGDQRARDIAVGTAITMGRMMQFFDWGMSRNSGWGLLVMASGYAIEPHEDIRKGAEALLDRLYKQLKVGQEGSEDILAGLATGDRHINLCMRGLIRWHQVTADARTEKLILALMSSYIKHGFMGEGLPVAGTLPEDRYPTLPNQGYANLESLAYAYRLTGDRKYVEAGLGLLFKAIQWMHNPGAENTCEFNHRMLRGPFPFLAVAHEVGILQNVPGAGAWLNT